MLETEQAAVIAAYVDPRQVTRDELQAIAEQEGLDLTDALAATYVGQGEAANFAAGTLDTAQAQYDPLATTKEEAAEFFANTGYTADAGEIAQFVASKTEEAQTSAIGAYVDPRQITEDEATEFLSAIGYNPTPQEIADFTGQLNDENFQATQKAAIDEYVDPRYVDPAEVQSTFEALGLAEVTQEDIDKFVGQYNQETQLGTVADYLSTAQYNTQTQKVGELTTELQTVSELLGKQTQEVTQADVDFVVDLIAQQNITQEQNTTQEQNITQDLITQYDVNADGTVDIADQTLLETALQGDQDVTLADTSIFGPSTGLYQQLDQQQEQQQQMAQQMAQQVTVSQQQARDEEFRRMRDDGLFTGAALSAAPPDVVDIDYMYDFESIFANPEQEALFGSPYANRRQRNPKSSFVKGGQVESENDMLLRILGDM